MNLANLDLSSMSVAEAKEGLKKVMEELKIPALGRQVRPNSFAKFDVTKFRHVPETQEQRKKRKADEALEKADFSSIAVPIVSKRMKKKQAKMEKQQWLHGKGGWGDLKTKEKTDDDKKTLEILSMRSSLNPTRHYKHTDVKNPKYFQVGTVVDNPVEHYDRVPKKKRKKNLLDELMADEDFRRSTKKKYMEVLAEKSRRGAVYHGKAPHKIKKVKKKKKAGK